MTRFILINAILLGLIPALGLMHWLRTGQTRYGKSEAEFSYLKPLIASNAAAIVVIDPKGTLNDKLLLELAFTGQLGRVHFDDFDAPGPCPGYRWIRRSTLHGDLIEMMRENERFRNLFVSQVMFHRGLTDASKNPYYEAALRAAAEKFQYQVRDSIALEWWLANAFDPHDDFCRYLMHHLLNPHVRRHFLDWFFMPPMQRRAETGPAQRLLEVLRSVAFVTRCGPTVDVRDMIDRKVIQLYSGKSAESRLMQSFLIQDVIDHCMSGAAHLCILSIDEAANHTDEHVAKAMCQAAGVGKGLFINLMVQNPLDFMTPKIRHDVWGNSYHMHFRQADPEAAALCAEDIGTCLLSPDAVWYTETRYRQEHVGMDLMRITTKGKSKDDAGHSREDEREGYLQQPQHRTVGDQVQKRKDYGMQTKDIQRDLMNAGPGWMHFRAGRVSPQLVYSPMELTRWHYSLNLQQAKLAATKALIRSRSTFRIGRPVSIPAQEEIPELKAARERKASKKAPRRTTPASEESSRSGFETLRDEETGAS